MVWFKVDDGFYTSQKVLSIPRRHRFAAVGLWTMAGNWSGRELTDGRIPVYVLEELGATETLIRALVDARLWLDRRSTEARSSLDRASTGIEFVNWDEYQPTRAEVEADRAKSAERQRKWRERHKGETSESPVSNGVTDGVTNGVSNGAPTRPDPTTTSNEVVERPRKRGSRLPEGWNPSAETITAMTTECPGVDLRAEHNVFTDYWVAQPGQKGVKTDWDATWRNWMRRKQGDTNGRRQSPEERARTTLALATEIDTREIGA